MWLTLRHVAWRGGTLAALLLRDPGLASARVREALLHRRGVR